MQKESNPKEDIEFLSNSWNRLKVLDAIRREPKKRRDLKEMTDISRVTLSRILADLEDRGWIIKSNGEYEPTTYGKIISSEFTGLTDYLETADHLGDTMEWLQPDEFDFELTRFDDADVITPTWEDISVQVNKFRNLFHECDRIRTILTVLAPEFTGILKDVTQNTDVSIEIILKEELFDTISENPNTRHQFEEIMNSKHVQAFRYEGDKDLMMVDLINGLDTHDEVVMLCGYHKEKSLPQAVRSTDPVVREWAETYFESCKSESRLVQNQAFVRS